MSDSALTPLEAGILRVIYGIYRDQHFPAPDSVTVLSRRNTGAGRYVDVSAAQSLDIKEGYLDMAGRYIRMEGVPFGMMAVVAIAGSKLVQLELAVYGEHSWNGVERNWSIEGP